MKTTWIMACMLCIFSTANCIIADVASYSHPELLLEPTDLLKTEVLDQYLVLDAREITKYKQGHVPRAVWIDHAAWADTFDHGKDTEGWKNRIGQLGINTNTKVVVYDDNSSKDAARIWWILRYWGVNDVRLLNGGWFGWNAVNNPIDIGEVLPTPVKFVANPANDRLSTKEQLLDTLKSGKLQIVDARSENEFCGVTKLTNKRGGAIPGAKQLDWTDLLDSKTKRFKPAEDLQKIFSQAGIKLDEPTATYCQSGGRASVMVFGMELMGAKHVSNYYPSWSEWSNSNDTPVVPGKAKDK